MEQNVDYTIFGHTHIPNMVVHDNITLINPGAFKDGYYAVIEDDYVTFYLNNTIYKKFKTSW